MYLIFDTETTGLPKDWKAPLTDFDNWPRMVQLAWQLHDIKGELIEVKNFIIKPDGFEIPFNAQQIHGISTEIANKHGISLSQVLEEFLNDVKKSKFLVGHNVEFDINIVGCELLRTGKTNSLNNFSTIDTKNESTDFCALPGGRGGKFKWPTLSELYQKLFNEQFAEAHNASADVEATTRCFLELIRIDVIAGEKVGMSIQDLELYKSLNNDTIQLIGLNIEAYKTESSKEESSEVEDLNVNEINESLASSFAHLHVHSQYSILQATSDIDLLVQRAVDNNMHAIGLTDHSNMFGSYKFINTVINHPVNMNIKEGDPLKLKPILGCELNVCKDHLDKKNKDPGYQITLL
jgi:DNA polymerase-3 subunit alpha